VCPRAVFISVEIKRATVGCRGNSDNEVARHALTCLFFGTLCVCALVTIKFFVDGGKERKKKEQ
jgi:2C-methyl-D-erythritol 2,4-cyclodiphosphate synthase